jgi:hypothetical protein
MVFAQGGALAVDGLRAAAERGDVDAAVVAAKVATGLLRACEGALRYAGHANSEQYLGEIRPTLTPPVAPPKMSGLHWRDHEALIAALQASGDAWQWLGSRRPELLRAFRSALSETYAAHSGVCEHFVGTEAPSLLAAQGSSRSAVGVLAQFRRIRLAALPDPDAGGDPGDPGTNTPKEAHSHALDA